MTVSTRERTASALASAAILGGMIVALVIGLRPPPGAPRSGSLISLAFTPPPPPPPADPPSPPAAQARKPTAAAMPDPAAPAARQNRATPIIAPPPPVVLVPPPVLVAPQPGTGASQANGAAPVDGAGSGAGGTGTGTGGGGAGGAGGGTGVATHARQTGGHLSPRDAPDGLIPPGGQVVVGVRFTVTAQGQARDCRVTRSSGVPGIDAVPCRLIEQRYRFRPARDRAGQPTPETIDETHTWFEPDRD